jgi:hypothetical protein
MLPEHERQEGAWGGGRYPRSGGDGDGDARPRSGAAATRTSTRTLLLSVFLTIMSPDHTGAQHAPAGYADGGLWSMCVDEATGLLGPGQGEYANLGADSGCSPKKNDCQAWCNSMDGCLAVTKYTDSTGGNIMCKPAFNTTAMCVAASAGGNPARKKNVDSVFYAACCFGGGVGTGTVKQYTAIGGQDIGWGDDGTNQNTCYYKTTSKPQQNCMNILVHNVTWEPLATLGIAKDVTYTYGVQHSYGSSSTEGSSWSKTVSHTISGGFSFFGIGAKYSSTVSGTTSHMFSQSISASMATSSSVSTTYHFLPGVVWQLKVHVRDNCGYSVVNTLQLAQTPNVAQPPCCLPGYFQDPSNAHSACAPASNGIVYSICNATR